MKVNLSKECTMISDENEEGALEQPVIIEYYDGSGGLSITGANGDTVFMPYRMVKEVCKQMLEYAKGKS